MLDAKGAASLVEWRWRTILYRIRWEIFIMVRQRMRGVD